MIHHIVSWNYADGITKEKNSKEIIQIKQDLEALAHIIPGVVYVTFYIDTYPSSTADVVLDSVFENEEKLLAYQAHPEHQKVIPFIKQLFTNRTCLDFEIKEV